jgi:hypothetical protein
MENYTASAVKRRKLRKRLMIFNDVIETVILEGLVLVLHHS